MHFFVPTANDPAHARMLYDRIRKRVGSGGDRIDNNHIFRLRFDYNGRNQSLAVGDSYREVGGDPVFAIFKAPSHYVVCTRTHGAIDGDPIRIEQDAVKAVEEFDS